MEEGDCTLVCYLQPSGSSTAGFFLVHLVLGRDFIRVEAAWLDCCMFQFYMFVLFRPISKKTIEFALSEKGAITHSMGQSDLPLLVL